MRRVAIGLLLLVTLATQVLLTIVSLLYQPIFLWLAAPVLAITLYGYSAAARRPRRLVVLLLVCAMMASVGWGMLTAAVGLQSWSALGWAMVLMAATVGLSLGGCTLLRRLTRPTERGFILHARRRAVEKTGAGG